MKSSTSKSSVQGEGDYVSAKKYNEHAQAFAQSGKVEQAARKAAPRNEREQDEMRQAEAAGRSHAKSQVSAGKGEGSPERRQPDKQAPGKHPEGHNPLPKKVPGR
ncbi:MAG: hypothetical protein A2580_09340 [Hydrogenophilales bacterium RIFOXYD1_FULL_62_11]|nr:MAG: hypothetical protein A2580_09340 [Hydrogenophilales bacterium RIFOXYD1_FULL_62_11]